MGNLFAEYNILYKEIMNSALYGTSDISLVQGINKRIKEEEMGMTEIGGDNCHLCGSQLKSSENTNDSYYGKNGYLKDKQSVTTAIYRCGTVVITEVGAHSKSQKVAATRYEKDPMVVVGKKCLQ